MSYKVRPAKNAQNSNQAVEPDLTDDYHRLDYSALPAGQFRLHPDSLTLVTATLMVMGVFLFIILLSRGNIGAAMTILIVLLFAPLVWLVRKYGTKLFHVEKLLGYQQFAQQNHFAYTNNSSDTAIRDTLKDFDVFRRYKDPLQVDRRLSGEYRNHSFTLSLVRLPDPARTLDYIGLLSFAVSANFKTSDRPNFEDQAHAIGYVDSIEYPSGYIYCIMRAGIPATREDMMRLFQTFDLVVDLESNSDV